MLFLPHFDLVQLLQQAAPKLPTALGSSPLSGLAKSPSKVCTACS
jgi:hypothetical protein